MEKDIKLVDAAIGCIPIVGNVSNLAQGLYKLAHTVDSVANPVEPGLKTSIKIHVLSKDDWICGLGIIPIVGNVINLGQLILYVLGIYNDDLKDAVDRNDEEVVYLSLMNSPLEDPVRARDVLARAASNSNHTVFKQIFEHRDNQWSAADLMEALSFCNSSDDGVANAQSILEYWNNHGMVLDISDSLRCATDSLENFLQEDKMELAEQIIQILPEGFPFRYIEKILPLYSCCQYDDSRKLLQTGVLTEESRNTLIVKSGKPSRTEIEKYVKVAFNALGEENPAFENDRKVHLETLLQLLERAQLQPDEIANFISLCVCYNEFAFVESLIPKYEHLISVKGKKQIITRIPLSPQETSKILAQVTLSANDFATVNRQPSYERRGQFVEFLLERWDEDISP